MKAYNSSGLRCPRHRSLLASLPQRSSLDSTRAADSSDDFFSAGDALRRLLLDGRSHAKPSHCFLQSFVAPPPCPCCPGTTPAAQALLPCAARGSPTWAQNASPNPARPSGPTTTASSPLVGHCCTYALVSKRRCGSCRIARSAQRVGVPGQTCWPRHTASGCEIGP